MRRSRVEVSTFMSTPSKDEDEDEDKGDCLSELRKDDKEKRCLTKVDHGDEGGGYLTDVSKASEERRQGRQASLTAIC